MRQGSQDGVDGTKERAQAGVDGRKERAPAAVDDEFGCKKTRSSREVADHRGRSSIGRWAKTGGAHQVDDEKERAQEVDGPKGKGLRRLMTGQGRQLRKVGSQRGRGSRGSRPSGRKLQRL